MSMPHQRNRTIAQQGFTLIEVIIVVVIVAILASIAIPAYFDQVTRSKRADAAASLLSTAQQLEQCFTANNTYVGCLGATIPSEEGEYSIAVATPNATTYVLTATPAAGSSTQHDAECRSFVLDQTGAQTATGSDMNNCW